MTFLDVKRQGSTASSSFRATTDAGEVVPVGPDGKVGRKSLVVQERGRSGRIKRATGSLEKLDELLGTGALPTGGKNFLIAVMEKSPPVNFSIGQVKTMEPGVLKIALHFIVGFVRDVDRATAMALLPFVLGRPGSDAGGEYVRTWGYDPEIFPGFWPPSHQVTCYPSDDGHTYVTVMLFGVYAYVTRLPIQTTITLRYLQPLVGPRHPILEYVEQKAIDWGARLTPKDDKFMPEVNRRLDAVRQFITLRVLREQCRRAAQRAKAKANPQQDDFLEKYRSELQMEAFDSDIIHDLMIEGMRLHREGNPVWQLKGLDFR